VRKNILATLILVAVLSSNLGAAFRSTSATPDLMMTATSSSTNVSGYISTNTTWTLANSPYIVTADVIVVPNVFLTIEPGVVVKFTAGTNLVIDGALIAQGNTTHVITFTSNATTPAPGDWGSIRFRDASPDYISRINWIEVSYGARGISLEGTSQSIYNSTFPHNNVAVFLQGGNVYVFNSTLYANGYGIYSSYAGGDVNIFLSSFSNNSYGIYCESWAGHLLVSNSSFFDNDYGVHVYYCMTASILNSSFSNNTCGVSIAYRVSLSVSYSNFYNNTNGILLRDCAFLSVFGSAFFNNTCGVKVSYYIESISVSVLNCSFVDNTYGMLTDRHRVYELSFRISKSNFLNNEISGIDTFGSVWMTYSTVADNGGDSIALGYGGSIHYSNIYNNSEYNVRNTGSLNVNATNNWWGTTNTTIIEEDIYDYFDDYNLGVVFYQPFIDSPVTMPPIAHDIAITNVTASPTSVTAGGTVYITVNVVNEGGFDENVTVTVRYDSVQIGNWTGWVYVGQSQTLQFYWYT